MPSSAQSKKVTKASKASSKPQPKTPSKPEKAKVKAKAKAKTRPKGTLMPVPIPQPPQGAQPPVVNVRCRRGSDKLTEGQSCNGLRAYNESQDRSSARFRCIKCNFSWSVQVGGEFVLR